MRVGQVGHATDTGRRRRHNEDSFVDAPPLFAVADGMGGAQAGELASDLAATALREREDGGSGEETLVALIQEANRRVYERAVTDRAVRGMGTTITAALVDDAVVRIGHVGDSRAYRIRDGELEQLTQDHSLVAELLRSGKLSPEEAENHPQRSVITRALGTDPDVDVDTFAIDAGPGDVFLLCSDGLTSMVANERILELVEANRRDLDKAAKALVAAANRSGGEDNITVVLFEIADAAGRTAPYPAVEVGAASARDDEDTLTEADRVPALRPAVDTMVVRVEEIVRHEDEWLAEAPTAALAPPAPPRTRPGAWRRERSERAAVLGLPRRVLWIGAGLCILLIVAALVVWGLSRAYFVGAQRDGRVAVYQGVPFDVVGSLRLYRPVYVSNRLRAAYLSPAERRRLFDHDLVSRDRARDEVASYEQDIVP
jgi:protein phosphatase